jgi:hypothetical protein
VDGDVEGEAVYGSQGSPYDPFSQLNLEPRFGHRRHHSIRRPSDNSAQKLHQDFIHKRYSPFTPTVSAL